MTDTRTAHRWLRRHRDTGHSPERGYNFPIGHPESDYSRVKCFVMLKDVHHDGGPLGLVPGSHLWPASGPGPQYLGPDADKVPGHVKAAVPAGGMVLFDMRALDCLRKTCLFLC